MSAFVQNILPSLPSLSLHLFISKDYKDRGSRIRTHDLQFWRSCQIKKTVQFVPTAPPFVLLALLNLMPFDALLMLSKNLCKFDSQLPKNRHS